MNAPRLAGRLLAAVLPLLAIAACDDEVRVETSVERGQKLFVDPHLSANVFGEYSCATCHATAPGDPRRLPGANLGGVTRRPSFWGGQDRDLLDSVNVCLTLFMLDPNGLDRDDPRAADLYEYLASLPATDVDRVPFTVVEKVADAPAGDATRGRATYDAVCRLCHGDVHTGAGRLFQRVTVIPEETIAEHGPPAYTALELRETFVEKIRHGNFLGYAGQMPPFSLENLTDQEIGDLLAYFGIAGGVDGSPIVIETDEPVDGCPTVVLNDEFWQPSTATYSQVGGTDEYAFQTNMPGFSVSATLAAGDGWTGRTGIFDVDCGRGICVSFSPDGHAFYDAIAKGQVAVDVLSEHQGVVDEPFSVAFAGVEVHARDGSDACYYLEHAHFGARLE